MRTYVVESYSNLVPLRYPASVAHKTRTRGVSAYDCGFAIARKPRKLRGETNDPQRDVLLFNINELSGGRGGIRTLDTLSRMHAFQACALNHSATLPLRAAD